MRAIDDRRIEGRQIDWGAWISPVRVDDLAEVLAMLDWPATPEVEGLNRSRQYFLVGFET